MRQARQATLSHTMPTPPTLLEELTALNKPGYHVTELLTELLRDVGRDACLVKRNIHSTYFVVSRCRDICDRINTLAATAGEDSDWGDFYKYTATIISLEEYSLILLFPYTED
jgi:hypothetical protein